MDLSSKDFALNFRGFEHDDPETVQRFTAFCEANFALSPEKVGLLKSSPDTMVLAHGGSLEELEALAKVLREIGAVVDVSPDTSDDLASLVGGPSTQELHRLFGEGSESSNDDAPNFCPYSPPLGRSLYLFSGSDSFMDRRSLRLKERNNRASLEVAPPAPQRYRALILVGSLVLTVGISALVVATLLLRTPAPSRILSTESRALAMQSTQSSRREGSPVNASPARALSGSKVLNGITIDLKILSSPKAVSVSSLSLMPSARGGTSSDILVRRIDGEPTFLSETTPGEWQGAVILSVSFEEAGKSAHFTIPASIVVKLDASRETGRAFLETSNSVPSASGLSITRTDTDAFEVSGIPSLELPLS